MNSECGMTHAAGHTNGHSKQLLYLPFAKEWARVVSANNQIQKEELLCPETTKPCWTVSSHAVSS